MERKNLGIIGSAAAAAAIATFAGREAQTQTAVSLESHTPAEAFVEWTGARSPNLVSSRIDGTRRKIHVVATTNAPVFLDGACPPPSTFPGWRLNAGSAPVAGRDSAEVDSTAVERTGENGTFTLRTTASARADQSIRAKFQCERMEPGSDGLLGTPDDVSGDQEELEAIITSVGGTGGAPTPDPFVYREEALLDRGISGMPVELSAAVINNIPMVGDPSQNIGGLVSVKVDPVGHGLTGRVPIGFTWRVGRVHENVTGVDGTEKDVTGTAHCGFVGGGWSPILAEKIVDVRIGLEAALGVCRSTKINTGPGTSVPGVTDVAGRLATGLAIGGKNLAGRVGVDLVLADQDSLQNWGPNVGVVVRF